MLQHGDKSVMSLLLRRLPKFSNSLIIFLKFVRIRTNKTKYITLFSIERISVHSKIIRDQFYTLCGLQNLYTLSYKSVYIYIYI
jgi:hypothetical protein